MHINLNQLRESVRVTPQAPRRPRFGRIYYERLMSPIEDFAMLFDNVSPYAAERVWIMFFARPFPFRLITEWRELGRAVPESVVSRLNWFDVHRRMFKAWCGSVGIEGLVDFRDLPVFEVEELFNDSDDEDAEGIHLIPPGMGEI